MVFIFVVTLFCFSIGLWIELGKLNFFFFFMYSRVVYIFLSRLYFTVGPYSCLGLVDFSRGSVFFLNASHLFFSPTFLDSYKYIQFFYSF